MKLFYCYVDISNSNFFYLSFLMDAFMILFSLFYIIITFGLPEKLHFYIYILGFTIFLEIGAVFLMVIGGSIRFWWARISLLFRVIVWGLIALFYSYLLIVLIIYWESLNIAVQLFFVLGIFFILIYELAINSYLSVKTVLVISTLEREEIRADPLGEGLQE